ncbi:thrombospondin-type laminin G domain and EAR repeat-containing protein-like [Corticium candelabrum]|uniref:thrombospondin-type laminin G domain and EAR repeat-containing protein-like n=1 Tax=Corticium candelabrum TaxID=121492 RepID=UPI002E2623AA|nr:thrombospondin-type laminin G domain and EAR repeat-containing protein-like [Corticium candelabrum]
MQLQTQVSKWKADPFSLSSVKELPQCGVIQYARKIASIPARNDYRAETFEIDGSFYVMVVSYNDGSKHGIDSIIYRFDGNALEIYQSVATNGARDAKYFEINGQRYLAIAQYYGDRTSLGYGVNSQILKWRNKRFEHIQSLPTKGAYSVAHFNIENDTFIAFANLYDNSHSVNSHVYKWISGQFVLFQSIPSLGAISIKYFQIGNLQFIVIAHHYTGSTYNTDSKIYLWSGAQFEIFQSISTFGAYDVETFTSNQFTFILFANNYNQNTKSNNIDSIVYIWNGVKFEEFQSIASKGATDFQAFSACDKTYVAIANNYDGSSGEISSVIYNVNGAGLQPYQHITVANIIRWSAFTYGNSTYLFAGPSTTKISYLFKWVG